MSAQREDGWYFVKFANAYPPNSCWQVAVARKGLWHIAGYNAVTEAALSEIGPRIPSPDERPSPAPEPPEREAFPGELMELRRKFVAEQPKPSPVSAAELREMADRFYGPVIPASPWVLQSREKLRKLADYLEGKDGH